MEIIFKNNNYYFITFLEKINGPLSPSMFKRHLNVTHYQTLCTDQFKALTSPPLGKPWAFDHHSCPRSGEFDTKDIPKGGEIKLKVRR